ncbi:hypothetical protein CERZMDRAFT_86716 [Cercospora zeae-maydis SCOH1-5]|uniref:Uncharacterized protein n=1 Tax=Cercospora zeae-maydis SCOH1-5 TaxID=717836 RepID=A0A6A6F792_9PEZI|nr:hypothetical protein CERZMDRAFT_86716 [Cercospora zeae-maydis SCOH1-5]
MPNRCCLARTHHTPHESPNNDSPGSPRHTTGRQRSLWNNNNNNNNNNDPPAWPTCIPFSQTQTCITCTTSGPASPSAASHVVQRCYQAAFAVCHCHIIRTLLAAQHHPGNNNHHHHRHGSFARLFAHGRLRFRFDCHERDALATHFSRHEANFTSVAGL